MVKKSKNPYNLLFGQEPGQLISRSSQQMVILEEFLNDPPVQQVYMITGIRGTGKTVFMTDTANEICSEKEWIRVELSSASDMLSDLASALASEDNLARFFQSANINLSFFGIGLEVKGSVAITNIQVALTKMLESIKKHNKKVLVCIDEVTASEHMKVFASAYQIFVRKKLPLYLLMTGLYENIDNLQNEDNLTFLHRAPKLWLKPLNIGTIADNYKKIFGLDDAGSLKMAKLTKGYSFAFQVLGYYTYKHGGNPDEALPEYRQYLEDYVYDKIWSEMSRGDRRLAYGIAKSKSGKSSEIKEILNISSNEYNPYRDRLKKKGIINAEEHGYISFILPLFEDFVIRCYETEEE